MAKNDPNYKPITKKMATFKTALRVKKEYSIVYIRIAHRNKNSYINTGWMVHQTDVTGNKIFNNDIIGKMCEAD